MSRGRTLHQIAAVATLVAVAALCWVLIALARDGLEHWHWWLLWRHPREIQAGGGVGPEIVNTMTMVSLAECFSLPLGWCAAVWLSEYVRPSSTVRWLERLFIGLQSIPAIVVGLVAFQVIIGALHWPLSVGTGTVALAILNLPQVVVFSRQAMAGVPQSLREGSLALGATPFQTVWTMVLPASLASLVDQMGLSWARLAGEAALLIFTAGLNVGPHWGWFQPGETLAVHLWSVRTEGLMPDRASLAAETGILLIAMTALAIVAAKLLSNRITRRQRGPGRGRGGDRE